MKSVVETISIICAMLVLWAIVAHCTACAAAKRSGAKQLFREDLKECRDQYAKEADIRACDERKFKPWGITITSTDAGADQ